MDIRQLRYFIAVAEELHFGRAAQRLHMSQPPLSVQVRRLEEEVGANLFERNTRRVTLTAAGRHLQTRARQVIEEFESMQRDMRDYADGIAGELRIGFVSSASYTVLPDVVRRFRHSHENVTLSLLPLTSREQVDALRTGSLDLGIMRDEIHSSDQPVDGLHTQVVHEERLAACLPAGHPLARGNAVSANDVGALPMISYPQSLMPGYVARVSEVLAAAGRRPKVIEEVVHQETALGFVAAGLGMTILPESVKALAPQSIAVLPLDGSPTTKLIAVWPARPERAPVSDAFIQCLHDVSAEPRRP